MSHKILKIDTYVSFFVPFWREEEWKRKNFYDALEEICNLSNKLQFELDSHGRTKIKIELQKNKKLETKPYKYLISQKRFREIEIVKFSAKVPFYSYELDEKEKEIFSQESLNEFHLKGIFNKRVSDLLIITNLSRIGCFETIDSLTVQNNKITGVNPVCKIGSETLLEAKKFAEEVNYPPLQTISFEKAWNWAIQKEGFRDGFGNSPVSRALCAFSRFLEWNADISITLLWAVLGIEAIYVKGKESIMEQVREKIQAFLGEQKTHKKLINEMYSHRSSFVHGGMNFPSSTHIYDGTPEYENFNDSVWKAEQIAIAILIATLQEMIRRDWSGIDFQHLPLNISEQISK